MSENSAIEWTDHTFNPWIGCTKISPACVNCYAADIAGRFGQAEWGPGKERPSTSETYWEQPLKWQRAAKRFYAKHGRRQRVFCASMADVFDNEVDAIRRGELFDLIEQTPDLEWLLLTKRIGNVPKMMIDMGWEGEDPLPDNVWLGITVCNQEEADRDIPKLLEIPATVRFLSMEPLLGMVDLTEFLICERARDGLSMDPETGAYECCEDCDFTGLIGGIGWVITGGESGAKARLPDVERFRSLRDQCRDANVPFFFKQWGTFNVDGQRVGKKVSGNELDGRTHLEFPSLDRKAPE